jgi:hypothetical protein
VLHAGISLALELFKWVLFSVSQSPHATICRSLGVAHHVFGTVGRNKIVLPVDYSSSAVSLQPQENNDISFMASEV